MVFSSLIFLFAFLPLVLFTYYLCPQKMKNTLLFLASLVFYAWGEPRYILIMLFSTVFDYVNGLLIQQYKERGEGRKAKAVVLLSVIINLGILGFFKYSSFVVENVNRLFSLSLSSPNIALPLGISFYTFQTLSYTIDVYSGEVEAQRNIIDFGAFVTLFPQLVAGPIVRYKTIATQLTHRQESVDSFAYGIVRFVTGLGKKVLLANNIGQLWAQVSAIPTDSLPVVTAWLGAVAFSFQIYFDFSGYSDMAIGLGQMFGFRFLENFNYPYLAKSITEFWRRWHISLGTWFREYVYIPLGGNRNGAARQICNLLIVWLLTGLWHGASWHFVAWGLYYGLLLVVEKQLFKLKFLPSALSRAYTLVLVVLGWVLFASPTLSEALAYIKVMFGLGATEFINQETIYLLYTNAVLLFFLVVASTEIPKKIWATFTDKLGKKNMAPVKDLLIVLVFLLSVAFLVGESYNPFLYFRF